LTIGSLLPPHTRKSAVWLLLTLVLAIASSAQQKATVAPASPGDKSSPSELVFSVDPARSSLHWTLDTTLHLVHGTFAVKRGEVVIDPATGNASGEIIVDASSGKTDNDSRDKKMHQEILETARFPEIAFRLSHVEGLATPLNKSPLKLNGTFTIHGTQHDMIVPADIEFAGGHWRGTATLVVPYIAWGIKNPSNFLLKASPTVDVTLELAGDTRPASKVP
jgi:polyisoprenoid-binding protein YceI